MVTGTDNVGNTVTTTLTFVNDSTAPVNSLSLSGQTGGGSFLSGNTVYYHGSTAGSFTITNGLTDSIGPGLERLPEPRRDRDRLDPYGLHRHPPSPLRLEHFSWTGGATSAPTEVVTGTDNAGNTVTTTLTFVNSRRR